MAPVIRLLLRFRPTMRAVRTLLHAVWVIAHGGWQAFVWGDVRSGLVNLRETTASFRLLVRAGMALVVGLLAGLLFNDAWRAVSPLVALNFYYDSLAGAFVPQLLVPITLGLLVIGWAYVLCGALHVPWWAKLPVVGLYFVFVFSTSGLGFFQGPALLLTLLSWGCMALLLAFFVIRWPGRVWLELEFPVTLALVATTVFSSYFAALLIARALQATVAAGLSLQLGSGLQFVSTFLWPFLLIAGIEVAELAQEATGWVTGFLRRRDATAGMLAVGLLLALLLRTWYLWGRPLVGGQELPFRWGALAVLLALAVVCVVIRHRRPREELPAATVPIMAVVLYMGVLIFQLVMSLMGGMFLLFIQLTSTSLTIDRTIETIGRVSQAVLRWNEVYVSVLVVAFGLIAWWRARHRGRMGLPPVTLFALLFGGWLTWWVMTRPGRLLDALHFDFPAMDALFIPTLLVVLVVAWARRAGVQTMLYLWAAAVLSTFLRFQDVLSDPLSPLFGLLGAGALVVSFSIFVGVMAAGDRFGLNDDSRRWPRASRALLYFGYAIMTVSYTNWLMASHQVGEIAVIEQLTRNGFVAIGLPLAFYSLMAGTREILGERAE